MGLTVFVTGTDTDVGKTVVAAGMALALKERGLDIGVMKPAVTGCRSLRGRLIAEDVEFLAGACGSKDSRELVSPYMLKEPLAPEVAAELEGVRIDIRKIINAFRKLRRNHEILIVEGAGGLLVPIKKKYFMLDLIAALSSPAIIVARPGLGTINHTLMTVRLARAREIGLAGIIINDCFKNASLAERTNPEVIRRYSNTALLGILPHLPNVSVRSKRYDGLLDAFETNIGVDRILDCLRRNCS